MATTNLVAFDRKGAVIVVCDGAEILVHGGDDERPLWRKTLSASIVGLGAAGAEVVALEEGGRLSWFRAMNGEPLGEATFDGARALAMALDGHDGRVGVLVEDAVVIATRGQESRRIAVSGASAVAFSDDGARIAIGSTDGKVRIFAAGEIREGEVELGAPVASICWNAKGLWIASADERVYSVERDGSRAAQMTRAGGMKPDCLTCSADGALLGMRLDAKTVVVLVLPSKDTVATFAYLDREVGGVAFGPAALLGIALVGGDGNIMDLANDAVKRTDTHPGRTHNRWMLRSSIEASLVPRAQAAPMSMGPRSLSPASAPMSAPIVPRADEKFPFWAIGALLGIAAVMLLVARFI